MIRSIAPALLVASGLLCGCVLLPWLARKSEISECKGSVIDNLDGKPYRLSRVQGGDTRTHSVSLRIDRDDCTIAYTEDLSGLGVVGMFIKNPRSADSATVVIQTSIQGRGDRPVTCTSPIQEFDPMDFVCPPEAGGLRFVLEPIE